jgi:hypothetical protein
MAAITRWTFANMRDEALRRAGRYDESDTTADRMEHFVTNAYLRIAATFFHQEMLKVATPLTIANGARVTSALPADLYMILTALLIDDGDRSHALEYRHAGQVFPNVRADGVGIPKEFCRLGTVLRLDRATDHGDYTVDLLYYAAPTTPDFDGSDESELLRLFDEAIVQYAMALMWPSSWRFDMADINAQLFTSWIEQSTHPRLRESPIPAQAERPLSTQLTGGHQG